MYFLNTTRRLQTPMSDETLTSLVAKLTADIAPSAGTLEGLQGISWLLSTDRRTMQAFSQWASAEDLPRAEHSEQHIKNSAFINDFIGGLASPQEHTYFELIGSRKFV